LRVDEIIRIQNDQKILLKEQVNLLKQIYTLQGGTLKETKTINSDEEIERKAKLYDQRQNK
jgi:hypothetical protein